jgi:dipeptidyl-peptidase-4
MLIATATAVALLFSAAPSAPAKGDDFLRLYAETRRFRSGHPVGVQVAQDGSAAFFLRSGPKSPVQALFMTDLKTGETRELLNAESLLKGAEQQMSVAEKARLERMRISARGFTSYVLSKDGSKLVVGLGGRLYLVTRPDLKVTPLNTGPFPIDPQLSQDGRHLAYASNNDVFAVDLATNKERRITRGGTEDVPHGLAEFVAQEEMGRFSGFWWSPDGKWIAYQETDQRPLEKMTIADPMHPERTALTFPYPRAGKANAIVKLGITSAAGGGKTVWVAWDAAKYPYLATVKWKEGAPLTILVQNRIQTEQVLLKVDPATGKTTPLLTESDPKWLNLDQAFPVWLKDGSGFFWLTERNGAPEVELRDATGALKQSWVKPEAHFDAFAGYDDARRTLYFNGMPDPTRRQVFRVVDGGAPEALAVGLPQPAMTFAGVKAEAGIMVVNSAALRAQPVTSLHRLGDLGKVADLPSVALAPPLQSTTEIRTVGQGPKFHASITRPRQAQRGQKLPVLVSVYGGPGHPVVRHAENPLHQWYADQGFIVVQFDGRGTPGRGAAWERAIWRDFSEVILEDQVAALKALAAEVPEMDLGRVGIEGWSFGGYMGALAVMKRPDVFKAGVAGAPVVDWRDYDTHYTERYLGLPDENKEGYDRSSLLTWAPKLERPLLVLHGTADDNVYFLHSLKLSDALFKAGKPHVLLPLAGLTHMVPDPAVTERLHQTVVDFFKRNL